LGLYGVLAMAGEVENLVVLGEAADDLEGSLTTPVVEVDQRVVEEER